MKFSLSLSALWRSLRVFAVTCACVLMLFSNALPAYSLPNPFASDDTPAKSSDPTGGEANLLDIEAGAQKAAIRQDDLDLLSGKNVTEKSNEGLNEVQGAADLNEMKRPSNTQVESIESVIKNRLEQATGQK